MTVGEGGGVVDLNRFGLEGGGIGEEDSPNNRGMIVVLER